MTSANIILFTPDDADPPGQTPPGSPAISDQYPGFPPMKPASSALLKAARMGPSPQARSPPGGFQNPGVYCYRNAPIVMLMNTPPFVGFIQRYLNLSASKNKLLSDLDNLAKVYHGSTITNKADPVVEDAMADFWSRFNHSMPTVAPFVGALQPLSKARQEDADEWLSSVINNVINQLPEPEQESFLRLIRVTRTYRRRCPGSRSSPPCKHNGLRLRERRVNDELTLQVEIPDQDARKAIADKKSANREKLDNAADNVNNLTLEDCITAAMKATTKGAYCSACYDLGRAKDPYDDDQNRLFTNKGVKRPLTKQQLANRATLPSNRPDFEWMKIRDLPEVLFMSIKRFTNTLIKNSEAVIIPETLDVTPWLEPYDRPANCQARYKLKGVVSHAGTKDRGHYITYVEVDGQWWRVNDLKVQKCDFQNINNDIEVDSGTRKTPRRFTPFMMSWVKISESEPKGVSLPRDEAGRTGAASDGATLRQAAVSSSFQIDGRPPTAWPGVTIHDFDGDQPHAVSGTLTITDSQGRSWSMKFHTTAVLTGNTAPAREESLSGVDLAGKDADVDVGREKARARDDDEGESLVAGEDKKRKRMSPIREDRDEEGDKANEVGEADKEKQKKDASLGSPSKDKKRKRMSTIQEEEDEEGDKADQVDGAGKGKQKKDTGSGSPSKAKKRKGMSPVREERDEEGDKAKDVDEAEKGKPKRDGSPGSPSKRARKEKREEAKSRGGPRTRSQSRAR